MALTATFNGKPKYAGKFKEIGGIITFDNSYVTNGMDFTPIFKNVMFLALPSSHAGFDFQVDYTNKKIKVFQTAGLTPAGTISAPTITTGTSATTTAPVYTVGGALTQTTGAAGITGVQAPTFTGTAVAAGAESEVANATDLSSLLAAVSFWVTLFKN